MTAEDFLQLLDDCVFRIRLVDWLLQIRLVGWLRLFWRLLEFPEIQLSQKHFLVVGVADARIAESSSQKIDDF